MKAEIKLKYGRQNYASGAFEKDHYFLCAEELRRLFKIPKTTKTIVLVISTEPMLESYKFISSITGMGGTVEYKKGEEYFSMDMPTKNWLLAEIGNPTEGFFSVEY